MRHDLKTAAVAGALAAMIGLAGWPAPSLAQAPAGDAAPAAEAPAAAAPDVSSDEVVARVGDATITEGDLALAEMDFAGDLAQIPEDRRRSVLIDVLVDMELLAEAARDAGLDQGEAFERRVEFLRTRALRNAYVEREIVDGITDDEVKAEYDKQVAAYQPQEEIRARHILVDTKEEAEKIISDLDGGAAFEELAKQSKDGTAQNGGDLGYFRRGQMVEPFENAAFALEPGAVTKEPIQTQFGWHVIKLEDKRMSEPPALSEVEEQLRSVLLRQKFETVMAGLRDKYPVEIVGEPAEEAPEADPGAAPEAPADGLPTDGAPIDGAPAGAQ